MNSNCFVKIQINPPSKKIQRLQSSSDNIPIKDKMLDFVLSLRLFEHLDPKSLDKTLKELYRVIKPAGKLIFSTVNKYSPDGREMLNASRFIDSSDILKLLVNSEMFFV